MTLRDFVTSWFNESVEPANQLIWMNGQVTPLAEARISPEDRGFQFADGVYEALAIYGGKLFALQAHLDRLARSCDGMKLTLPIDRETLAREMLKLVKASNVRDGVLYLQLTRGAAPRNHRIADAIKPTLLFYARPLAPPVPIRAQTGASLVTVKDERWRKCWIKAIGLTASVLARMEVDAAGADEAAFVDEAGIVAEGTSSNLFFVTGGKLVTHPVGPRVLPGVTRDFVIHCAKRLDIEVVERPIHLAEAKEAEEVFLTSTTRQILWVREWDKVTRADRPGGMTVQLADALDRAIAEDVRR